MIVYSPTLGRDIQTCNATAEEFEAMLVDYSSPDFTQFAAPGVKRAYLATFETLADASKA